MTVDDTAGVKWMADAIALARRGPVPDPNPRVGCVLVGPDGRLLAEGFHRGAGTAHAEAAALQAAADAGISVAGGTAYLTLEPCHHHGRTPPCSRALAAAGVREVVYAVADPHRIAGGGAAWLATQGIEVTAGILENQARDLNRTWFHLIETGRPFVTWKFATTLDGRSAAEDGSSQWITGAPARADVHDKRAECGAVVVGTGTVIADNPRLTTRWLGGSLRPRQPLRVVVGEREIPTDAAVLDSDAPTLQLRTRSPQEVVTQLGERGIHHLWLEGGPTLAAAFLKSGLIDEVLAYVAPVLLGSGMAAVADLGVGTLSDAIRLQTTDSCRLGSDLRITTILTEAS